MSRHYFFINRLRFIYSLTSFWNWKKFGEKVIPRKLPFHDFFVAGAQIRSIFWVKIDERESKARLTIRRREILINWDLAGKTSSELNDNRSRCSCLGNVRVRVCVCVWVWVWVWVCECTTWCVCIRKRERERTSEHYRQILFEVCFQCGKGHGSVKVKTIIFFFFFFPSCLNPLND